MRWLILVTGRDGVERKVMVVPGEKARDEQAAVKYAKRVLPMLAESKNLKARAIQ